MGHAVEEYLAALYDWWDTVLQAARCPHCQCAYRRHQARERAAWVDGDHAQRILVLRIRCPSCGRTRTVLPDFLTPYRRYLTPVREAVVTGRDAAPPCEARTARRWVAAFRGRVTAAIAHVTARVLAALAVSRQEQAFLRGAPRGADGLRQVQQIAARHGVGPPSASGLLGWTNQVLAPQCPWAV